MKKTMTLLVSFLLLFNGITYGQTFKHHLWGLNETVTFNDVVNYLKDKSKIITEPSVYIKGEDIKFFDDYNTTTTLTFIENTQTLKCVFINDITNFDYVNVLRQSVFQQLGNPTWGYEKKKFIDIKEDYIMSDYYEYDIEYKYRIGLYEISISIKPGGIRIIDKITKEKFDALSGQGFAWLKESYKLYGKNLYYIEQIYSFSACIHKLDEYNATFPKYDSFLDNYDFGWQKTTCEIINKW